MREYFRMTGAGATQDELDELIRQLGDTLPDAYLAFLRETNGAEWCVHDVGGDCLQLWKAQEILELNEAYRVQHWLPDVVAIGSDGGSDAIVLDRVTSPDPNLWPVFRVGFGALDREEFTLVAAHYLDWVQREFRLPSSS